MREFTRHGPAAGHLAAVLACALLLVLASGSWAVAATQQETLHKAIQDFEALGQDPQKGMWRDQWEKLEARFEAISKKGSDYAAEAFFYQARAREELAARSKRKDDWKQAAKFYADFGTRYKKHPLADNAAYNRAVILSGPLDDKPGAGRVLDALIADYPDGDAFSDAIILRERVAPASAQDSAGEAARPSAAAPAAPASKADLERQKQLYRAAASEWRSLLVDNKRGGLRENWLNLEKSFGAALRAAPSGEDAHKAAFQVARSRDELAQRSGLKDDWQEAADLFAIMAAAYPRSSLADDSLYAQAEVMNKRLSNPDGAREVLTSLLSRYPDGDMAPKARKLLAELPAAKPAAAKPAATAKPIADAKPQAPAASSAKTQAKTAPAQQAKPAAPAQSAAAQKVSGSSGNRSAKAPAKGALLRYMEWKGDGDSLILTLDLSRRAKYRRVTLPADPAKNLPQRARIELIGCSPASALRQNISIDGAPVSAIKSSKVGSDTRLELALSDARSYKVHVLQNPYRIQIEVQGSKLISGAEDLAKLKPASSTAASSGSASSAAASSGSASSASAAAPAKVVASGNIVEQLGLSIKTIMIDAGHGGKDPGATGNGLREANITLDLAKKLGAELKKKGFTVLYTRDSNQFVALEKRTSLANNKKADVFVSIHVNASTTKSLHGLETYYLDVARSDAARVVAARENSVNVGKASDLQFILSDLTRNTKKEESLALSKQVQNACMSRLGRAGFRVRSNGVRSAPFYVLMGARMPAFLIEVGYLSNKAEADRIKNPKYIQAIAGGIADGIVAYQKQLNRLAR